MDRTWTNRRLGYLKPQLTQPGNYEWMKSQWKDHAGIPSAVAALVDADAGGDDLLVVALRPWAGSAA